MWGKVYVAPCVRTASVGMGRVNSRLLGGTGKKHGKVRVFPCQEPGLEQWGDLGMQKDSRAQAALDPVPIT